MDYENKSKLYIHNGCCHLHCHANFSKYHNGVLRKAKIPKTLVNFLKMLIILHQNIGNYMQYAGKYLYLDTCFYSFAFSIFLTIIG